MKQKAVALGEDGWKRGTSRCRVESVALRERVRKSMVGRCREELHKLKSTLCLGLSVHLDASTAKERRGRPQPLLKGSLQCALSGHIPASCGGKESLCSWQCAKELPEHGSLGDPSDLTKVACSQLLLSVLQSVEVF